MKYPPIEFISPYMATIGNVLVYIPENIRSPRLNPAIVSYMKQAYHDYIIHKMCNRKRGKI